MSAERTAIDDATIADIKSRVRLSEFIGRTVKLKRVGGEFVGLSPFKDERTPSFTVNDDKGFYHCFSSGKHGDIIEWVTETQGLNFRQAIDLLASETGTSVASAPAPTKVKSAPLVPVCHYEYQDETGFPYMRVTRFEPKTFRQFHWDCDGWANGKPKTGVVPYRLPEIVARPNDDIWLVEGEKDADTLASLGLLATTAPGGATAFPRDDIGFLKWFDGRRVYAIPDNDEAGAKWRERVAHGIADVKFLHLGGPKDATDYINAGHDITDLVRLQDVDFDALDAFEPVAPSTPVEPESEPRRIKRTKFVYRDPTTIPPREWLYGSHLIRRYVSLTAAPGGLGKSSLALVDALAMATHRPLFQDMKIHGQKPLNVWYWNGEDPDDENERRVAAAIISYGIDPAALENTFATDSGRDQPLLLCKMAKGEIEFDEQMFLDLEQEMIEQEVDVLILDPLVSVHEVNENDNSAVGALIKRLARLAQRTNAAIEVVHHVRKPSAGSTAQTDVNDARGAGALLGGVRSARVLNVMSEEMAKDAGIPNELRQRYFSIADGAKANMSPKSGGTLWRFLENVPLGNASETYPEGDGVGVVRYYELPKEAQQASDLSMSEDEMRLILSTDDTVRHWDGKGRGRKPKNWLGHRILDALKIHGGEHDAAMQRLIMGWIKDGTIVTRAAWADGNRNTFLTLPGGAFESGPQHHDHDDDAPF